MCLYSVRKTFDPPDPKERVAWKILEVNQKDKTLSTPFKDFKIRPNAWMYSTYNYSLFTELNECIPYKAGFHVYVTREDAREALAAFNEKAPRASRQRRQYWKVFKVMVADVTSEGTDGTSGVASSRFRNLVAGKMLLLPIK